MGAPVVFTGKCNKRTDMPGTSARSGTGHWTWYTHPWTAGPPTGRIVANPDSADRGDTTGDGELGRGAAWGARGWEGGKEGGLLPELAHRTNTTCDELTGAVQAVSASGTVPLSCEVGTSGTYGLRSTVYIAGLTLTRPSTTSEVLRWRTAVPILGLPANPRLGRPAR